MHMRLQRITKKHHRQRCVDKLYISLWSLGFCGKRNEKSLSLILHLLIPTTTTCTQPDTHTHTPIFAEIIFFILGHSQHPNPTPVKTLTHLSIRCKEKKNARQQSL